MQQGCFLTPLPRRPLAPSLLHRPHRQDSSRQPVGAPWRTSSSPGLPGACCPRRLFLNSSRLVPQTFLPDWSSKQTSSSSPSNRSQPRPGPQQQHHKQQPQHSAAATAQPRHNVDFTAAQAALDERAGSVASSSSTDGGSMGTSAKQLLQTAVHSLDMFEPRDTGSFEEEAIESFEEAGLNTGTQLTAHIVKANYEVLRLDETGAVRRLRIKRRDLLREHGLQPRDLRRIDPMIDFTKTSPSITIKEDVLLLNLGGIRAIVTADKALLFEPASNNTRKLLDTLVPRLQASAGQRLLARQQAAGVSSVSQGDLYRRDGGTSSSTPRQGGSSAPPFELEVLEGVLMVATGRLDAEVLSVTRRVGELLQKLPRDINPVNLEELRRIKQALVELENKADMLREMLEQIMDDEDELREINLSSRPRREERRKQRERERMERQLTRAREEMEEQARRNNMEGDERQQNSSSSSSGGGSSGSSSSGGTATLIKPSSSTNGASSSSSSSYGAWLQQQQQQQLGRLQGPPGSLGRVALSGSSGSSRGGSSDGSGGSAARQQRLAELYARHGLRRGPGGVLLSTPGRADGKQPREDWRPAERDALPRSERDRDREREGDPEEEFQDAQDALEELAEQEQEEEELEEVEDLLEYYLQRASATQSEAERLLEGARDLEESIGVSLSARRYEVNRLELMLSMGSFAAALGAMIAGIFGMNMKSTLELSVVGFWGVTGMIVIGCFYIFLAIMRYTQKKRIL